MKIIGITGGISTGKSTITNYLIKKGFKVIDADEISKNIVNENNTVLKTLKSTFGDKIINLDNTLNRKKLGSIVFSDEKELAKLNIIMAPYIKKSIFDKIDELKSSGEKLIFLDAPTLFEAGYEKSVDKIIVVYVNKNVQLKRLMLRDNLNELAAKNKINSQIDIEQKKEMADYIINNENDVNKTYFQVDNILKTIIGL